MDMVITAQLVFAPTGCQFPVEVKHPRSSPRFTSSSVTSSSAVSTTAPTSKIFISDILSCIHSYTPTSLRNSGKEGNAQIYAEFFDYVTCEPLLTNAPVVDGQKLLLFVPPVLAESLAAQLLHRCQSNEVDSQPFQTEEKERWKNLKQAVLALNLTAQLHQDIMEKEMKTCTEFLEGTNIELNTAKEDIPRMMGEVKGIKLFYDPEVPLTGVAEVQYLEAAIQIGEPKLREAAKLLEAAKAMVPGVVERMNAETKATHDFENSFAWKEYFPSTTSGEEESAVTVLMSEVDRKVQVIRGIVVEIGQITKRLKRCRHYCVAVANHVVRQHKKLCLLPEGMEAAREVVLRRIILRRAAHRLLAPLEMEYQETEGFIHKFAEKWSEWLPDKISRAVASPLPPLYPAEDSVAKEMDRFFVDVEEDETEKLLLSIGAMYLSDDQESRAVEKKLKETEAALQRCKVALETAEKEKAELEKAVRQLGNPSSFSGLDTES